MSTSATWAWFGVAACSFGCGAALAQSPPAVPPVSSSSSTAAAPARPGTLAQALEAAWQHRQAASASQGRVRQARAEGVAASAWLPAAPALELATRSDRWQADRGQTEQELALALPLWLPGQREARQAAASAGLAWAEAGVAADRLQLAGEVRQRAWALAAARSQQQQADQQAQGLQALVDDVARRVDAGELARTDLLEVQAEGLAARAAQAEAAARVSAALTEWTALTGLPEAVDPAEAPPAAETQAATGAVNTGAPHPALQLAELEVERASRALEATRRDRRDPPELNLSLRQERPGRGQSAERSLGMALRWNFGPDARNAPLHAAALGTLEAARAQALTLGQALQAESMLARQQLRAAQEQSRMASERAALLDQRLALVDAAFRAGEADLPGLLRARSAARQAALAVEQQHVALGLARARLLQALGQLP